ncbi:hypothetical protein I553_8435 [Mycobacterium xenopi 4042]|uniref:Uncharacterized protein n=1 Tax=Mycobacterium xenopi 4042 TaxID=1299334 RepID=X7ZWU6_MYCXE|nr:hypothetical protein I553_8435 [Mycobacterium xenopi 4042]
MNAWSTEDLNVLATLFVNSMIVIAEAIEDAHSAEALEEIKRIAVKQLRMIAIGWPVGAATREVAALHRRGDDESMATKMSDLLGGVLASLRYEPTEKRLRVCLDDELVADTRRGLLVWERVGWCRPTPCRSRISRRGWSTSKPRHIRRPAAAGPAVASAAHSCPGAVFDVVVDDLRRAAPRSARRSRSGDYVVLDFGAFEWRKKTSRSWRTRTTRSNASTSWPAPARRLELQAGCWPHRRADAAVRDAAAGAVLSPTADVAVELEPSDTVTYCAYKGRRRTSPCRRPADLAWTTTPLHDAEPVRDRIAFFDERVDVIVDGERRQRRLPRGRAEDGDVAAASNRQAGDLTGRDHRPVGYDVRRSRRVGVRAQRHGGVGVWRHLLGHQGW